MRCKPLLGTFVEITTAGEMDTSSEINEAFLAIEKVQALMGFHDPQSELSKINAGAHIAPLRIDLWTAKVLNIALDIYQHSEGLFNCGIGQHLIEAQLLPKHTHFEKRGIGSLENLYFLDSTTVRSDRPLCLDLGGIAKGFAVDMAVEILKSAKIPSGIVNAGGDLRVFGNDPQAIHLRNPANPHELIHLGDLSEGAVATSSLYFRNRDKKTKSFMVNPMSQEHLEFSESYSVLAKECVYADALTKVVGISGDPLHRCLRQFSAQAMRFTTL